ncbi:MAG TPA: Lpg1974 family pore-forming outer membrane protein, partial [Rhabdochlamydiaceae bacterium]|nr:Lpg1974 family pore-forming outer membrane protein [Rhabdochlamydiaceae bacterium]
QCLECRKTCCTETGCRVCSCDPDDVTAFYVTGEALYWKAAEGGLTNVVKGVPIGAQILGGRSKHPRFNWHWGFRLDAGYNMCYDLWDIYASWTRFHFQDRKNTNLGPDRDPFIEGFPSLFPFWVPGFFTSPTVNQSETEWKVRLDVIDLQLGREFYVTNYLSLKPHLGLRTAWIHQTYNITDFSDASSFLETGVRTASMDMKNNFWGIGIVGGLDTTWDIGCGFTIYGNGALSILDGHFQNKFRFSSTFLDEKLLNSDHQNMAVLVADLALGLRWDTSFGCDWYRLGIWTGYEQHVYFEQNQFMNYQFFSLSLPVYYTNGGNLSTNGLVIGMEFAF